MSEELDLSKSKWNLDNEIYLRSIKESVEENYPMANFEEELSLLGYSLGDLLQIHKVNRLMNTLNKKYPDDV
jgi:acetone carboxylase gamma subunit